MKRLLSLPLVACAFLAFAAPPKEKEGDELKERMEFYELQNLGSKTGPAAGGLAAWFEARSIPFYTGREGSPQAWEEMGPTVLVNGWGGMENAGRSCAVLVDPRDSRVVFVGAASGGIWRSTDGAKSWTPVTDHQASLSFGAMAFDSINPDIVYAGTGENHGSIDSFHGAGLLRSRDSGKTWELVGSDVFIGHRFSRIVSHPKRSGYVYAATSRGVFRSVDAGSNWVELLKGNTTDLVINSQDPESLIAGYGAGNGLFITHDGGTTWSKITTNLTPNNVRIGRIEMAQCAKYPNVVYASLYRQEGVPDFYKTTDFGRSWVLLPNVPNYAGGQYWYDDYVATSPVNPNIIFVGGTSTHRSLDGGLTWEDNTKSYDGGTIHPDHHSFGFDPSDPNTVYLCTDGGVFRSRNVGNTWESVCRGMGTVQFQHVDVHPTDRNIAYGGTQDNGSNKFIGTTAWKHVFSGDGGVTRVNWKDPNIVYTEYVNLAISKSYDAGENWDWGTTNGIDLSEGALFYAPYNLDPSNPDILVAGTRRVYRTTDGARNWHPISPLFGRQVSAITISPTMSQVIYAGSSGGEMKVTADTGKTWYDISKGVPGAYVSDICIDPRNSRTVYIALAAYGPSRLLKSTDAGANWKDISDNLPQMPMRGLALHPRNPDMMFVATEIGVFVSKNGGGRWERLGKGLPNAPVFNIVVNAKTNLLTVGTHGRGAWRIPLPE